MNVFASAFRYISMIFWQTYGVVYWVHQEFLTFQDFTFQILRNGINEVMIFFFSKRWNFLCNFHLIFNFSISFFTQLMISRSKISLLTISGLPKAKVFGQSRSFSLFGLRLRPPKFYSKYSAFNFVLKISLFLSLKEDRLKRWYSKLSI